MNNAYQCEPFSHQDVDLTMAFNRVKKFLIKDPRDLEEYDKFCYDAVMASD